MSIDNVSDSAAETWTTHRVGPLAEIPIGEGRAYAVAGQQVAVFRLRDGRVHALSGTCSHAGGPLADGLIDGVVVICPLHSYAFELATGCSRAGQPAVRSFPAYVDETGQVVVELS